ncbi:hypothetical protein SAMN05444695_104184 [Rhodococcus triatomae]|uniref:Dynamin family protein n=1 Tax=Rhodococcus triatomae TaxID=300028 RepID=A0A1G8GS35_9NOCA|nr:hypothetical protein SAMN05444695_104184 [Rhodococcus triatomae]
MTTGPAGSVRDDPSSAVPSAARSVIARWNPEGLRRLGADGVHVAGPPRSGKSTIEDELRRRVPAGVDIVADPAEASVVLMLLDASAALGREELAVLDAAAPRPVDSTVPLPVDVVFALNKTDVHRDWPSVAERNAELLARHDSRFGRTPIHPVSARGPSGVEELLTAILDAARARRTPQRRVESSRALVANTEEMIAGTARAVRAGTAEAALRAERVRVAARRDGGRAERVAALRGRVQLAKVELLHEVAGLARTATTTARTDIDRADRRALADFPSRLAEQSAEHTAIVEDLVARRVEDLARSVGTTVSAAGPGVPAAAPVPSVSAGPGGDSDDFEGPERRRRGLEDQMAILLGASAGLGLGRLAVSPLTTVPALDIASIPVTLVLGAGAAWWLMRARAHIADRAHMRQWANETVAHVRGRWEQIVLARLLEAESRLGEQIIADARAHAAEVDERLAAIDLELRRLNGQRAGKLAACEKDLEVLAEAAQELASEDGRHVVRHTERENDAGGSRGPG